MEFRDAVKYLRTELGLTQMELANALHINFATVGRWENGRTLPARSITAVLLDFARSRDVSAQCMENLTQGAAIAAKERLSQFSDGLYPIEHASLCQLIDDASFPIYVCDMETDEILYINRQAEAMVGAGLAQMADKRCYVCLMHRDSPCPFCHKNELVGDHFQAYDAIRPFDATTYRIQGKLIRWNGRNAQVRYVTEAGSAARAPLADIAGRLLGIDYEAVAAINAETGEVRPYIGSRIDVEQLTEQINLPHIRRQLETKQSCSLSYTLQQAGKTMQKRAVYMYLDEKRTTILCAAQNLTEYVSSLQQM